MKLYNQNWHRIHTVLKPLGVSKIEITYYGGGDSGAIDEIICSRDPEVAETSLFDLDPDKWTDMVLGSSVETLEQRRTRDGFSEHPVATPMETALDAFCFSVLSSLHGGWEVNEGSSGRFTFDVLTGRWSLKHHENVITTVDYDHTFDLDGEAVS